MIFRFCTLTTGLKFGGFEMKKNDRRKNKKRTIYNSFYRAVKGFGKALPILLGIVLLLGLFNVFISKEALSTVFVNSLWRDTLIGTGIGSISAGNPVTSYLIGGELLQQGVSLYAVCAFLTAWVTVGLVQFPAEASILGKRFSITRNILSFIFAILVSILTVSSLTVIG